MCVGRSEPNHLVGVNTLSHLLMTTLDMWVYILKHKGEVLQRFQEWKALVEKSSGRKIKTLRSDNGGEYTSTEFTSFLTKEGIKHELTIPHTPQQNGVAERLNRTLIEGVRTMLADSKLPHRFWAEALSTAVYLRNRSPTKALEGVTPYEAWERYQARCKLPSRVRMQCLCTSA